MITVKVTFEDGNTIISSINCSFNEAINYYIGNTFQFGDTWQCPHDKLIRAVKVELI